MELTENIFNEKDYMKEVYNFLLSIPILVELDKEKDLNILLKDQANEYYAFYNINNDTMFVINKESGVIAKKVPDFGWLSLNSPDQIIAFLKVVKQQSELLDGVLLSNVLDQKQAEEKEKNNKKRLL